MAGLSAGKMEVELHKDSTMDAARYRGIVFYSLYIGAADPVEKI
jgi:hypothetical protein